MGFEYGYAMAQPNALTIWEAQFGDFSNVAQVIIDQFITSSQAKWERTSGIVLLLPHGNEGMGPEHSNAYMERYLAACAEDNIQVVNLTTPAQFFHALRRQVRRPFRRPLVVMSPKSLLRHKLCVSPVNDFVNGKFEEILDDPNHPKKVKRLVLCSGKIYYDMVQVRDENGIDDIAIVRFEQLYPLNMDRLHQILDRYREVSEIAWVQEETKNRGAWSYMHPLLHSLFPSHTISYIGRGYAASPATGSLERHRKEQEQIVNSAILGEQVPENVTILTEGAEAE